MGFSQGAAIAELIAAMASFPSITFIGKKLNVL